MADKKEKTLNDIWQKLDEQEKIMRDVGRWLRFQNIGKLKEILETELDTDEKKIAFENTDGEKGVRDISTVAQTPSKTVHNWWQKWFRLGIVEPSGAYQGRLKKICSLDDIGIKIPKILGINNKAVQDAKNVAENEKSEGITVKEDDLKEIEEMEDDKENGK